MQEADKLRGSFVSLSTEQSPQGLIIQVMDPEGGEVYRQEGLTEHKFELQAKRGGKYEVCLESPATDTQWKWQPHREVLLDLETDHPLEHKKVQSVDLDEVWKNLGSLQQQIYTLKANILYLKQRAHRHNKTNTSTSARVVVWAAARAATLVGVSAGQILFIRYLFAGPSQLSHAARPGWSSGALIG